MYRNLSVGRKVRLAHDLAVAGWSMNQFWADAAPGRPLCVLPTWRMMWYHRWFEHYVGHGELLAAAVAETRACFAHDPAAAAPVLVDAEALGPPG